MKKQTIVKKLHKPIHPALSIATIACALAVFIIIMVMSTRISQQPSNQSPLIGVVLSPIPSHTSSQPATYHSKFMQITLAVPEGFQIINEWQNGMTLESREGRMKIERTYSNETTLDGAIALLEEENHIKTLPVKIEKSHITINGLDAVVEVATSQTYPHLPQFNYKAYDFFPAKYTMYSVNTSTPGLYSILDQVAQSIKFMP